MSLLTVVRDVCAVVGVTAPTSVLASINANRTMFEMLACANEMAQRIAYDTRDWTVLMKSATNVGTGQWVPAKPDPLAVWTGAAAFNIPADYKRMLLTSNMRRSIDPLTPMRFIPDYDEWLWRRAQNVDDGRGEWIMVGGQILINPVMAGPIPEQPGPPIIPAVPAVTATYAYLDRNCVALTSGGFGDTFMADTDTFRLDERLLRLGMTYDWKMKKGSPYAEDMGTYSDAIANAMGRDKPSPIIIGRHPASAYARTAYPWQVSGPAWPFP